MKIVIGNDHSAVELREVISAHLREKGIEVEEVGTFSTESSNYPEWGEKVARKVVAKEADLGIAICGTGVGISIAANKVKGIRACVCSEPYSARMSRQHNNANVADDINYEELPRLSGPSIRQISEGLVMRRYFLPVSETIQAD